MSDEAIFINDPSEFTVLCITIKTLGSDDSSEIYKELIQHWKNRNFILNDCEYYFEADSNGKNHLHGIIHVRKNFFRRRLQTKGFHIYTTDCNNLSKWISYCIKSQKQKEDTTIPYLFDPKYE